MSYESNKKRQQIHPAALVGSILRSDEFLRQRRDGARGSIARTALHMANDITEVNRGYETDESRQLRLVAVLPDWLKSQHRLDTNRSNMTRQEKNEALRPVLEFNHIVREMIDMEQYSRMSEITSFIRAVLLRQGVKAETIQYADQSAKLAINGMRHEIAAESVLSMTPGVDSVESADNEDELSGRDINVEYEGYRFGIDIKASQRGADEAMIKSPKHDYIAVWSGFSSRDFGDSLILDRDSLSEKTAYYQDLLESLSRSGRQNLAIVP